MSRLKAMLAPALVAFCAFSYLFFQSDQHVQKIVQQKDIYDPPPLSGLSPTAIAILTLGHKPLYEAFINLWLLQTLIETHDPDKLEEMKAAIDATIKHQPAYESLYMLSCFVMIDDFKHPKYCQKIILAGLEVFPQSWRLPITQGYVHAYLLEEPAQAASFFLMASSRPFAPEWTKKVAQALLNKNEAGENDLQKGLDLLRTDPEAQEFFRSLSKEKRPNP